MSEDNDSEYEHALRLLEDDMQWNYQDDVAFRQELDRIRQEARNRYAREHSRR